MKMFLVLLIIFSGVNPNDIALMKLEKPIKFSDVVKPISLPPKDQIPSGTSIISGWGSTGTSMPNDLKTVDMPIVPFNGNFWKTIVKCI